MATQLRRTVTLLLLTCGCLAVFTRGALAHPLGNFTINHYSRVELAGDALRIRYVLDMAEVPSIQEARTADTDGDGSVSPAEWDAYKQRKLADIMQQLDLTVDGQKVELEPTDVLVSQPIGQADIPLVRLEAWFKAVRPIAPNVQHQAVFRDRSDPARLGWREMVVHAESGASLADANVPAQDVSNELRSYPDDLLQNPLDRREARWSFVMDGSAASTRTSATAITDNRPTDPFAALVTATELNPAVVLLALLGAAILGGIHAASPGHGKSIMAAYIVGTRGTFLHASALALSVTVAHTTGVLVLGILTVLASNVIFPERLYPWLTLLSGLIVLVVGGRFLLSAFRGRPLEDHHHHDHGVDHNHSHSDHDDNHHHDHPHQDHAHVHTPTAIQTSSASLVHTSATSPGSEVDASTVHTEPRSGGRGETSHPSDDQADSCVYAHIHTAVHTSATSPGSEVDASTVHTEPRSGGPPGAASHHHSHPSAGTFAPTWRSLFALGISGGVVPSGSALVVLLSSVALGRLGFGLVLIVAFGIGMALVLVTTGVLLVHAGRLMLRLFPEHAEESPFRRRIGAVVPMASATLMTLLGVVATYQGVTQLGIGGS